MLSVSDPRAIPEHLYKMWAGIRPTPFHLITIVPLWTENSFTCSSTDGYLGSKYAQMFVPGLITLHEKKVMQFQHLEYKLK